MPRQLDAKEATLRDRFSRANVDMQARRDLVGEGHTIERRLGEDRRARGKSRATEAAGYVVDRLADGSQKVEPPERSLGLAL